MGYQQFQRLEQAWRTLKDGLRPIHHWAVHRIHAPVVLTVLLERTAELACGDTWCNIRDELKQVELAQPPRPSGTV